MTTEITNPHDKFFKEIFGQPEIAADFMVNYLPAPVVAELDLSAPELVKDSFVDANLQEHFSDLLYKVKLRSANADAFIFFLFEHKSVPDEWVALQILRYLLEVWEQCKREGAKKLPPIFPIVFYHGTKKWNFPANFNALINFSEQEYLQPFVPEYKYFLCDLTQIEEPQVIGTVYLQATLLLMKNIRQADLRKRLDYIWKVLKNASQVKIADYIVTCFRYISAANNHLTADELTGVIRRDFSASEGAIMAQLAKDWIQQGLEQGRQQGLQEGLEQGLEQGRELGRQKGQQEEAGRTALRFIARRIGIIPATQQDFIRDLPLEQLEALLDNILDFTSASDLNNWLAIHTTQK